MKVQSIPAVLSGISAATLTVAIAYELGYFNVLSSEMLRFLSLNEILVNSLTWLPTTALGYTVSVFVWYRTPHEALLEDASRTKRQKFWLESVPLYLAFVACIWGFMTSGEGEEYVLLLPLFLIAIIFLIRRSLKLGLLQNYAQGVAAYTFLFILGFSYWTGTADANKDLWSDEIVILIEGREVPSIRTISEGTFVRDEESVALMRTGKPTIRWNLELMPVNNSRLCVWFGISCETIFDRPYIRARAAEKS